MFVAIVALTTQSSFADIYGFYTNLDTQISRSENIVVLSLYEPPPSQQKDPYSDIYDPTNGTASGVLQRRDVNILGTIKGDLKPGTTITAVIGSFGYTHSSLKKGIPEQAIVHGSQLSKNTKYLVFMKETKVDSKGSSYTTAINRELNMLNANDAGPYSCLPNENIEQAITRLTGLRQ